MKMRTKLFVLLMSTGLFSIAADAASSDIGRHAFRRSPAVRVVNVNLQNNSNGAITKAVVETRFEFNDRAFGSSTVSLNGAISPGQTQALSFQVSDPKDGVYHVLIWYWANNCYGIARIPISGDKFSTSSGSTCSNAGAKAGVSPYEVQIAEAVNDKFSVAATAYKQKNFAVAVEHFNAALKIDPKHEQSLHFRGHSFLELGKIDQAVTDFTAAIAVSKNKEHLYLDRAKAHKAAKNSNAMVADYTRAIAVNPSVFTYELRGKEYSSQKKYDLAVADYTKIIELRPAHADAYYWRGLVLVSQEKEELAAADFKKVTELEPKTWQGYYQLGWLLSKDPTAAVANFTKALEFAPADPLRKAGMLRGRGVMQIWLVNFAAAKLDFELAIQHDPENASAYFYLGAVISESSPAAAVENYTKAINLDPKNVKYLLTRAELYSKQGKAAMAEADIVKAIATDPNSAQPYALRAVLLCNQGKKDLAAADEAKVIALGGTLKEKCW